MIVHIGTHVDTPAHYIAQGKNLDDYPIEKWIRPAHVVDIKDKEAIRPAELEKLDIKPGDALLFKTENSRSGRSASGVFKEDFVPMSIESADFCVKKKVGLVGIDYNTVDKYGDEAFPVHHRLMENDMLILEGINLKDVPAGQYTLLCLPMKIKGVEGSPARAILVR
jgi:arylformamidase